MKANDAVTAVRQRLSHQKFGRRGRKSDRVWAHRMLLLRGGDTLSSGGVARLHTLFRVDDVTGDLEAVWTVKKQVRRLLACSSLAEAHEEKMRLGYYVMVADMPETDGVWSLVWKWWAQIEVLVITGVGNAKTEAANTMIKNIKRTARGFRNADHYRTRILLASAARSAA
ncbi:MAG: transposase [Rhodococcus sp. (in: high G+C Gram-positive bacteria)]|uniref:transposase n=1 Tax=Rhodococcus sp. TaxID=1831 RepID=UPI002ADA32F4|nr:transposase [Rhodococcus sp. (in: high G+C Gram-positive bacteria)]